MPEEGHDRRTSTRTEEDEHEEEDEHDHAGHDHGPLDPHFWFDPHRVERAVNEIAARLSVLDPGR